MMLEKNATQVLSVTEINEAVKSHIEAEFSLVWLRGEISNFTAHRSGHLYFSLKDNDAQISSVMFRGSALALRFKPKAGDEVVCRARLTVYVPRGNYQLVIETMEPLGAGNLQRQYEELKAKLNAEGLFLVEHKKALPKRVSQVALITSPTGAAVRDMIQVLKRRSPHTKILVVPALVQGEGAVESLRSALRSVAQIAGIDAVIIGRGGGSIEDLWAFNNEQLARDIFAFQLPIISAVGHEIDFTIADFVADMRAPTPSAAAELVSQDVAELLRWLLQMQARLKVMFKNSLQSKISRLHLTVAKMIHPSRRIQDLLLKIDNLEGRLVRAQNGQLQRLRQGLTNSLKQLGMCHPQRILLRLKQDNTLLLKRLHDLQLKSLQSFKNRWLRSIDVLDSLSPLRVVLRGYSLVEDLTTRQLITSAEHLGVGQSLNVRFAEGSAQVVVEKTSTEGVTKL